MDEIVENTEEQSPIEVIVESTLEEEETTVTEVVETAGVGMDDTLTDLDMSEETSAAVSSVRNGKAAICFITAGQGESGYYTKEVLKESVSLFKDKPMYVDHEEVKPRALYWVGDINSVRYEESGIDGPGLYGIASVQPRWRSFVEGMLDSKGGVSIRARGKSDEKGVVRSITSVGSVDYVVRAGRGGRIMSLLESALDENSNNSNVEDNDMSDKEKKEEAQLAEAKVAEEAKAAEEVKEAKALAEAKAAEEVATKAAAEAKALAEAKTDVAKAVDTDALVEKLSKVIDERLDKFENRLKLVERESSDREIVKRVILEGFGEDFAEDSRSRIESLIWESRGDAENLEEHSKAFVESVKPMFDNFKKAIEDKYEEKYKNGKVAPPSILSRITESLESKGDDDDEMTEEQMEKELAGSIAGFIEADGRADEVQRIIIDNKVGA